MGYTLITGGSSGIGFELARTFLKHDHRVIIVASRQDKLTEAQEKLQNEFGREVLIYQQDLAKLGEAAELYRRLKSANLSIEILINNAGIGKIGATEKIDFQDDEKMMILNIINLVELCKLFLAEMYQNKKGKILNVSSMGAFQPGPYTSTYFASKSFVLSYSKAIHYEAKNKGVQISTLCPGTTNTNFFNRDGMETPPFSMSAERVAEYTYSKFFQGKEVIIPGVLNKVIRFLPEKLKSFFVARIKDY